MRYWLLTLILACTAALPIATGGAPPLSAELMVLDSSGQPAWSFAHGDTINIEYRVWNSSGRKIQAGWPTSNRTPFRVRAFGARLTEVVWDEPADGGSSASARKRTIPADFDKTYRIAWVTSKMEPTPAMMGSVTIIAEFLLCLKDYGCGPKSIETIYLRQTAD